MRRTAIRPGRAPASVATTIAVNPSASSQAFAQMAAEEPMHSPQYNALGAGGQRGDVSPDKSYYQSSSPM
jgi:hypothetical protein